MTKDFFETNVVMLVELEDAEMGDKIREAITGLQNAKDFISKKCDGVHYFFSDFDYAARQKVAEIGELLREARKLVSCELSYGCAILSLLKEEDDVVAVVEEPIVEDVAEETVEAVAEDKPKKVWTEDEIRNLLETNDTVLCGALKKLYNQQTDDEQNCGTTTHSNGVGFNGADAEFLSSAAKFLIKNNYLSDRQKMVVRKKMIKYAKQLTRLANA